MKPATLAAITAFALLGAPAAALAQDPAVDAYGGQGAPVLGVTENNSPAVLGETDSNPPTGGAPEADVNGAGSAAPDGTTGASGSPSAPVAQVTATESAPTGSLPFTGLDLGLIALGGLLLVGFGLTMRHMTGRAAPLA